MLSMIYLSAATQPFDDATLAVLERQASAVTAQVVGNEADQATAKRPSTRSRIALSADWPERRAVPVTERY
ncbi:hypothetical protein, partial [Novosphingobium sp. FKTRR1]|uniref:hypothetical protein n=1 Tax=Novosphingobium sp. FKTRR1 TaxID=2879118 RepID=UPI001CF0C7D7